MPPTPKRKAAQAELSSTPTTEREVKYPEIKVRECRGSNALTVQQMKDLLGWEVVSKKEDALFQDYENNYIRCVNNLSNRPLYMASVNNLIQTHLLRRWKYNGEPIIIGKYATVLNGQHTLISGCLAEQVRTGPKSAFYEAYWDGPITVEKLVVYGIDEDDVTVNTMDTCKPRSLADAIFRSEYFKDVASAHTRKLVSRATDFAVRQLWHRTGATLNAFACRRTHAESLSFIERHPRLLRCVRHILTEDRSQRLKKLFKSLGRPAALMYLMASCNTDGDMYRLHASASERTEAPIDWEYWDKAMDFWAEMASGHSKFDPFFKALAGLCDPETGAEVPPDEKTALTVKAWNCYAAGKPLTPKALALHRPEDPDGRPVLSENPTVGGIDIGNPEMFARENTLVNVDKFISGDEEDEDLAPLDKLVADIDVGDEDEEDSYTMQHDDDEPEDEEPDEEELERRRAEQRRITRERILNNRKTRKPAPAAAPPSSSAVATAGVSFDTLEPADERRLDDDLRAVYREHPNKMILVKGQDGDYTAFGADVGRLCAITGVRPPEGLDDQGVVRIVIAAAEFRPVAETVLRAGKALAVAERVGKDYSVRPAGMELEESAPRPGKGGRNRRRKC